MFTRSTCSLGLMVFNRPISMLARPCNVLRVKAASARIGMQILYPPNRLFHSNIQRLRQSQDKDPPSSKPTTENTAPLTDPEPQSTPTRAPTDLEAERYLREFSKLGVDAKLAYIRTLKSNTEKRKNDPQWEPGKYEMLMQELNRKEKKILDADTWYKKAFRSIAWGPTILINVILAILALLL